MTLQGEGRGDRGARSSSTVVRRWVTRMCLSISTGDFENIANRARRAAEVAGELHPPRVGPVSAELPQEVRRVIAEDLKSGAYQRAAAESTVGDAELVQR